LLWKNVSPESGPLERALRVLQLGLTQHANNEEMIAMRCDRGATIVRKIGLSLESAAAVQCLDEHWDGRGYSQGLRGHGIPLLARIACVAQHLDVFASEQGPEAAMQTMNERSGRWFDPELVRIANALNRNGSLWVGCWSAGHKLTLDRVKDIAPGKTGQLSATGIDTICEAFADVVDAKSPFTFRHSVGVTKVATAIAQNMGMSAERTQFINRAALLHDLGKLRVPNSILDKPGKPNADEWGVIQEHPALTRQILQRVQAFGDLSAIAGAHHEKLDGSGYPDKLNGWNLPLEARILAVADVYGALIEDRPYRAGLSREAALGIMQADVPAKLDSGCFEALMATTRESPQVDVGGLARAAGASAVQPQPALSGV
jgi:putative nucleotidyltransferase with HDIG domain